MSKIEKKILPQFYEQIVSDDKAVRLRLADWPCTKDDALVLREWNKANQEYTGRVSEEHITHILKTMRYPLFLGEDVEKYDHQTIAFK